MTASLLAEAIKTTLILAIALTLVALLRHRSAALRHWLLAAAIGCALAMPLLGAIVPAWSLQDAWPMSAGATRDARAGTDRARAATTRAGTSGDGDTQRSGRAFAEWDALGVALALPRRAAQDATGLAQWLPSGVMTALGVLWLAGVAIALLPLIAGYARLISIARGSRRIFDGRWRAMADEVARDLGLRRPIALLCGQHPSLLVTWGLARPRVLLPASAAHWPDHTLRIVLLHELAHVQRGDWAIQMAAELLRALCWFNPLAWIACTRLRRESELACDDAVLGRGIDRTDYAAQVLDVARTLGRHRRSFAAVATAMAHHSGLERRIQIMLNDRLNRAPLTRSARVATAVALIAIALPLAGVAARQNQASITSTVVDQSGAPVTGAEVMLTAPDCEPRTLTPDTNGRFVANGLAAGPYRIWVKAMGFAPATESMTLAPDQRLERRLRLTIGSVKETIVVRGASAGSTDTRPEAEVRRDQARGPANPLQPPIFVTHVHPEYPVPVHDAGVQGSVTLEGRINVDGSITHITTVSAPSPELAAAARAAVAQWRYVPTYLHGVPVEIGITVVIEFQL